MPEPNVVSVATSAALAAALELARPGQCIQLADGLYLGRFASAASGTAGEPITLSGSCKAVLSTGTIEAGYGLHLTGSHWIVRGISVSESAKGIVLDGSTHTVISGVDVGTIGAEGVHFRAGSSDGVIEDSVIHDTGLRLPGFGEGVYIGSARGNWESVTGSAAVPDRSDRVIVRDNRISNTSAEGVDAKEGTTGGSITGNVFVNAGHSGVNSADSWVDIKGNGYVVSGNSGSSTRRDAFQVHGVLPGWGLDNVFSHNVVEGGVPGYEVWVQSDSLRTVITPGPSGAARGMSNIRCEG
ncbi:right-handed parallel beta-helix repeat-containing protein [Microbacteriaceae bacterium 4G12]